MMPPGFGPAAPVGLLVAVGTAPCGGPRRVRHVGRALRTVERVVPIVPQRPSCPSTRISSGFGPLRAKSHANWRSTGAIRVHWRHRGHHVRRSPACPTRRRGRQLLVLAPVIRDRAGRRRSGQQRVDVAIDRRRVHRACGPRSPSSRRIPSLRVAVLEAEQRRLGRQRTQRRVLRGVADPRPGQRPAATSRRRSTSSRRRDGGTWRSWWPSSASPRASMPSWRRPAPSTWRPSPTRWTTWLAFVELAARHDQPVTFLDRDEIQAEVHSPRWLAGLRAGPETAVLVNPAKLAWGLADAVERRGGDDPRVVTGHGTAPAGVAA